MKTFKKWLNQTFSQDFLNDINKHDIIRLQQGWAGALEAVIEEQNKHKNGYVYVCKREVATELIERIHNAKPGEIIKVDGQEYRDILNVTKVPLDIG